MIAAPAALLVLSRKFEGALGFCLFKRLFHIDCPACGITHSAMSLFQGHVEEAFSLHPAGPVVVALLGLIAGYLTLILFTGLRGLSWGKEAKVYTLIEWAAVGALMIGWVGKLSVN